MINRLQLWIQSIRYQTINVLVVHDWNCHINGMHPRTANTCLGNSKIKNWNSQENSVVPKNIAFSIFAVARKKTISDSAAGCHFRFHITFFRYFLGSFTVCGFRGWKGNYYNCNMSLGKILTYYNFILILGNAM